MKRMRSWCTDGLAVGLFFWLLVGLCFPAVACNTIKFKAGRVDLAPPTPASGGFVTVTLSQSYTNPVVFVLPTNQNPDPAAVRIRNVAATSFQMAVVEPPGSNGPNTGMTVDYLVAEAGVHMLPGGTVLEVGTVNTTRMQSKFFGTGSATVSFANTYPAPPAVLVQIQTTANEPAITPALPSSPWMTATAINATTTTVQVALERSEDTSGTVTAAETIGFLALQAGAGGSFNDAGGNAVSYASIVSAANIVGWDNSCVTTGFGGVYPPQPLVLASKATRNGGDGGWLRRCSIAPHRIGLQVDEDQATDSERSHTLEAASIVLFSQAFNAAIGALRLEAGSSFIPPTTAGTASFTAVTFPTAFAATPLIFALPTSQGSPPAALRIRNINTTGFEVAAVEPTGEPGPHPSMSIDYIASTLGIHTLPDGTVIEAGSITTAQYQAGVGGGTGWAGVTFSTAFASPPAVLLQVLSSNSETIDPSMPSVPWLTVAARSVTTTGLNMALERAEATAGTVSPETIGYLAMAGNVQSSFLAADGTGIQCEALLTPAAIRGWDNGCTNINYVGTYTPAPLSVAHQASRNGNNGGWLRRCNLTANSIGLTVDEDRANDAERSHIPEQASILAFSLPFEACWEPSIEFEKAVTVLWDPHSGTTNPKAIPGARMQYIMTVTNDRSGRVDNNTLIITDPMDTNSALYVGDLDGSGSPIIFRTGTSGLNYSFISLGSIADDIAFSNNNGVDYTYEPTPDLDGFDPNVTTIRISLKGTFNAADIGMQPQFEVEFNTRVQ